MDLVQLKVSTFLAAMKMEKVCSTEHVVSASFLVVAINKLGADCVGLVQFLTINGQSAL